jgi:hypothetical protein
LFTWCARLAIGFEGGYVVMQIGECSLPVVPFDIFSQVVRLTSRKYRSFGVAHVP